MSRRLCRPKAALTLLLSLAAPAAAQPGEPQQLKIELISDGQWIPLHYVCELQDLRSQQRVAMAELAADDTFTLRGVPQGEYQMTITDSGGQIVHQELATVTDHRVPISVRLPKREASQPPSGPVSFSQLQHPPARKAFSAFVAAQRLSAWGDYPRAAAELQKAIRISPDYADAYTNLAVQHIRMGDFQSAVSEMQRVIEIGKPGPLLFCNLAYAQAQLGRYDEAMQSAVAALRLDANYPQAHYLVGALLARDPRTRSDAVPHLQKAGQTIPSAKMLLEKLRGGAGS